MAKFRFGRWLDNLLAFNLYRDRSHTGEDYAYRIPSITALPKDVQALLCAEGWDEILFCPKQKNSDVSRETILAVNRARRLVALLVKGDAGLYRRRDLCADSLVWLLQKQDLLLGCITCGMRENDTVRAYSFRFNRSQLPMFDPVINLLLGLPPEFDCEKASVAALLPEKLREENYALYNYGKTAVRLGPLAHSEWFSLPPVREGSEKLPVSGLLCQCRGGSCVFRFCKTCLTTLYLKNVTLAPGEIDWNELA